MSLDFAKHKNILIKILRDIYSDTIISPFLGFKGGTAAYLFYGLDRFSVDLDFDLLDETKEDAVFEQMTLLLKEYGKLKETQKKKFNLFYLLSYDNKDVNAQNIKIEINRRDFGSAYHVQSYLGIPMRVMVRDDMFAHKLVAMVERIGRTNRDIFDVQFFLAHDWPINKQALESRTGMAYKDFLEKCIDVLERLDDNNVLAGMGELLNEKQKAWAKSKLKAETLFLLRLALDNEK